MNDALPVEFDVPEAEAPPEQPATALAKREDAPPPAARNQATDIYSLIERLMFDTSIPIERGEQAFAFAQKVQAEDAKKAFTIAMRDAQAEMDPIRREAENKQTHSVYATFDALDRVTRPIYTKHGFVVSFDTADSPLTEHVRVLCIVMHIDGHERVYHVDMPCDGKGARGGDVMTKTHAVGSAFSYGKRYAFGNAFNIVTFKDDDGNAASRPRQSRYITSAQVAELERIAKDLGADIGRFCKYGKVDRLEDIPADNFERAKRTLLMKRKPDGGANQ